MFFIYKSANLLHDKPDMIKEEMFEDCYGKNKTEEDQGNRLRGNKGIVYPHQKQSITLVVLYMTLLLRNTKCNILRNDSMEVNEVQWCLITRILQNSAFCVLQKKECYTGSWEAIQDIIGVKQCQYKTRVS